MNKKTGKILTWIAIITFLLALSIWLPLLLFAPNGNMSKEDLKANYQNSLSLKGTVASTNEDYKYLNAIERFGMYDKAHELFFMRANNAMNGKMDSYSCELSMIVDVDEKTFLLEIDNHVDENQSFGTITVNYTHEDSDLATNSYNFYQVIDKDSATLYIQVDSKWYSYEYPANRNPMAFDFENALKSMQDNAYPRLPHNKEQKNSIFSDKIPFNNIFCDAVLDGSDGSEQAVLCGFNQENWELQSIYAFNRPLNLNFLSNIDNQDSILKAICNASDVTVTPSLQFSKWGLGFKSIDVDSLNAENVQSLDFAFEQLIQYLNQPKEEVADNVE